MDYLYGKNDNAVSFAKTINSFIIRSANSNPENIKAGYKPDGTAVEDYNDLCFTAPFLISASCAGDMNSDNMLNVFDLCLMQRILTGHIK